MTLGEGVMKGIKGQASQTGPLTAVTQQTGSDYAGPRNCAYFLCAGYPQILEDTQAGPVDESISSYKAFAVIISTHKGCAVHYPHS